MIKLGVFGLVLLTAAWSGATTIEFEVVNIAGSRWEYGYSVDNDTLGVAIEELTIFFDVGLYENLAAGSTPANWDPLVIEPDTSLPNDGFYDVLALSTGILPSSALGGFRVSFDFLGIGTPGSQRFDIVDPFTFGAIDAGTTERTGQPISEPASALLLGLAMLALGRQRSRQRPRRSNDERSSH